MKIESFEDFYQKAQELFLESPTQTRYSVTYRPGDQRLRIKVTDDKTTYNFETEDLPTVKRVDQLNSIMMQLMACPSLNFDAVKKIIQNEETTNTTTTTTATAPAITPTSTTQPQSKKK